MSGLVEHLVRSRIAGEVDTPREDNLRNIRRMLADWDEYWFGLERDRDYTPEEVLDVMARRVGISPDPEYLVGHDHIDPELTVAQLDRWRERLAAAAARGERVLVATGHPTGVLALHFPIAAALKRAGCAVLVPESSWVWPQDSGGEAELRRPRHVRCIAGVHMLASGGELLHTHRPEPMGSLLTALRDAGEPPPDLVVADHGWAGAAAQAGIETLGLADCNDPALFVAEEEGKPIVTVPLDDNVPPHLYDPLADHLLDGWAS